MIPLTVGWQFLTARPARTLAAGLLVSSLSFCGLWQQEVRASARKESAQALRDSVARIEAQRLHRRTELAEAYAQAVKETVVRDSVIVTRRIALTDTLWRDVPVVLATASDTVKALDALPALRAANDSLRAEVGVMLANDARFRVAVDSVLRKKDAEIFHLQAARVPAPKAPSLASRVARVASYAAVAAVAYEIGRRR